MTEQWQELKETIIEMRDNGGYGTQHDVCKFLANYMYVLEKQMQEPILDKIRAEIDEQYDRVHPYNISCAEGLEMALDIIDKYRNEVSDQDEMS